jgi:hypothetical protein
MLIELPYYTRSGGELHEHLLLVRHNVQSKSEKVGKWENRKLQLMLVILEIVSEGDSPTPAGFLL